MLKRFLASCSLIGCLLVASALAQEKPLREIFVPFDDLSVILENDPQRVFLSRQDYEELLKKAVSKPDARAPHAAALLAANYDGKMEDGRAAISGKLQIEVLNEGLQAIPLDLANVGIRSALLDGKPAPLGRNEHGQVVLFVAGVGQHELALELTALLQTSAATQTLQLTLPTTAAARLQLAVAGNVEVKAGASVVSRAYDENANVTRFELLPPRGSLAVVMSLNNKKLQDQRVVVANSVLVTEVTQGYERIHARVSHRVLHGAVDKFRFSVPAGFEVTRVDSSLLARWEMKEEMQGGQKTNVLEALLREPSHENVVLEISATRSPPVLKDWSLPRLVPLDVVGQVAVVGLLVDDRLQAEQIAPAGLLPLDAAVLTPAIPDSVNKAEPGAPKRVRQVVTYYAPGPDYSLSASITRPPAEIVVHSSALLVVSDREVRVSGQFILAPQAEDLFEARLHAPAGWQVTSVLDADGKALPLERYASAEGAARYVMRLPGPVAAGQQRAIRFLAVSTPAGWLENWTMQKLDFPQFTLEGATTETGAIGIAVEDDLTVRPEQIAGLTPLSDDERKQLVAAGQSLGLAYRFEARPFSAPLVIERTAPSLAAEIFDFFKLEADSLTAFYEIHYQVRDARTRELVFSLPDETPKEIAITGIEPAVVKETTMKVADGRRRWTVQLAERQRGDVRLTVNFTQRFAKPEPKGLSLPLLRAEGVEHQSALVGVEGSAELDIDVTAHPRDVDVGELYGAAKYSVSSRLVGAYGFVGEQETVKVDVLRRAQYALPAALVERAELVTRVARSGVAQSVVRYDLKTKATLLEIRLPQEAKLWSVVLDRRPMKPQRETAPGEGERLLLTLPAQTEAAKRELQVVYEMPSASFSASGEVRTEAPTLWAQGKEIPQAELVWTLVLPTGYQVRRTAGSVFTSEVAPREVALVRTMKAIGGAFLASPQMGHNWKEVSVKKSIAQQGGASRTSSSSFTDAAEFVDGSRSMEKSAPRSAPPLEEMKKEESGKEAGSEAPLDMLNVPPQKPAPEPVATPKPESKPEPPREGLPDENLTPPPPEPKIGLKQQLESTYWAEQGLSSLLIDVANDSRSPAVTFRSLGEAPELRAQVMNRARLEWAALGIGWLVALIGVGLTRQSLRRRVAYVVSMLLLGTIPLLATSRFEPLAPVFDACFFGALALVPYYLVAGAAIGVWQWTLPCLQRAFANPPAAAAPQTVALLLAVSISFAAQGWAQAPDIKNLKDLLPLLEPAGPISIPKDAIIVPYDPEEEDGLKNAEKVLLPYEKYVELWNRANPDKKLLTAPPPAPFALAGASYQATLNDADALSISGVIEIDLFSDKPVAIPLTLVGGVLNRATVDGQPARIQIVEAAAKTPIPEAVALLHLGGKGRKKLELTIGMGLERRGGWRIVTGRLPAAPATALSLTVPAEKTEVRLSGLPDKGVFESAKANDVLKTALGPDGALALQWRLKVAEGMVDQSLTAHSSAVVDVREDSLRMAWRTKLEFGRGNRDTFKLSAPADYLIESVTGENIRGWQAKAENGRQTIDVTLLKAATGSESLTVQLAKRGLVGQANFASFAVPDVRVESAALHQGEIAIRRSRRLDVRSITVAGLSRADADGQTSAVEQLADATDAAGIELAPFQSYRFAREGFQLTLSAGKLPQQSSALVRMIVRAEERGDSLDALVEYHIQGEPLYRARLYLPDGLEIDRLVAIDAAGAEATIDWAVSSAEKRKLLTVYLPSGQQQRFTLQLLGRLGKRAKANELPAPRFEVLDVQRQEGEVVIAPDRDTDVEATNLKGLERIPGMEVVGWLNERQRPLARLALRFRASDYSSTLIFTPRTPRITGTTLTNVKITPKEIQETLFFRFQVEDAGVRELAVLVPQSFAKARLPEALLASGRVLQKIVEPATGADGKPIADMVKVRFVLPQFVDGRIDLGLTRDRLLTDTEEPAAIPDIAVGRLAQRLIVIENSSRDEVVMKVSDGLEGVDPGQQAWIDLQSFLGADSTYTQAFVVSPNAAAPKLTFKTEVRQRAALSQATIGLAEHLLIVDEFGAYRGRVELKVANETEQFLEIELPARARLWTAAVAGQPVKPVEPNGKQTGVVRIPLIKTAQGEADYAVVLKYGGRVEEVRDLATVNFPLIKVVGPNNLSVEQSHVRLYLPKSFLWNVVDFGGTLKQVTNKATFVEEINAYYNKQILMCQNLLKSSDDFTKIRITSNLKKIQKDLYSTNAGVSSSLSEQNFRQLAEAQQEAAQQEHELLFETQDNRSRLNNLLSQQGQERTKNNAAGLGSNFDVPRRGEVAAGAQGQTFNGEWLKQNALVNKNIRPAGPPTGGKEANEAPSSRVAIGKKDKSIDPGQAVQGAPGKSSQLELNDYARQPAKDAPRGLGQGEGKGDRPEEQLNRAKANLERYGQRLDEQNAAAKQGDRSGDGQRELRTDIAGDELRKGLDADMEVFNATGLASLDVELPVDAQNYAEFLFTTPRGDLKITARPVSTALATRLLGPAWLLGAAAAVWLLTRPSAHRLYERIVEWRWTGLVMIVFGIVMLFISPLAGLLLTFFGGCQIAWRLARTAPGAALAGSR